jgi:hypothetical protein
MSSGAAFVDRVRSGLWQAQGELYALAGFAHQVNSRPPDPLPATTLWTTLNPEVDEQVRFAAGLETGRVRQQAADHLRQFFKSYVVVAAPVNVEGVLEKLNAVPLTETFEGPSGERLYPAAWVMTMTLHVVEIIQRTLGGGPLQLGSEGVSEEALETLLDRWPDLRPALRNIRFPPQAHVVSALERHLDCFSSEERKYTVLESLANRLGAREGQSSATKSSAPMGSPLHKVRRGSTDGNNEEPHPGWYFGTHGRAIYYGREVPIHGTNAKILKRLVNERGGLVSLAFLKEALGDREMADGTVRGYISELHTLLKTHLAPPNDERIIESEGRGTELAYRITLL